MKFEIQLGPGLEWNEVSRQDLKRRLRQYTHNPAAKIMELEEGPKDLLLLGPVTARRKSHSKPKYETKKFKQLRFDRMAAEAKAEGLYREATNATRRGEVRLGEYLQELANDEMDTRHGLLEQEIAESHRARNARKR